MKIIDNKENGFLTVSEVLEIFKDYGGYKLLAGKNGLNNHCQYMMSLETPNGLDWLMGYEFLMTSGYAIKDDTVSLVEVVRKARQKNISAIAIKENRYISSIPPEMVLEADKLDLPLILIPQAIIYTIIYASFYKKLFYKQNASLIRARTIDNRLLPLVNDQRQTSEVVVALSGLLGVSIAIYDNADQQLSSCYLDGERHKTEMERYSRLIVTTQESTDSKVENINEPAGLRLEGDAGSYYGYRWPLANTQIAKYMCVISNTPLDEIQYNALDHGSMIIAMKIRGEEKLTFKSIRLKRTITELILNKSDLGKDFYSNFEEDFSWSSKSPGHGIVISLIPNDLDENRREEAEQYILSVLDRLCENSDYLITVRNGRIFLFYGLGGTENVDRFVKIFRLYLANKWGTKLKVRIGISRQYHSIKDLPTMYHDCIVTTLFTRKTDTIYYEKLDVEKFLFALIEERQFKEYYTKTMGVLEAYDEKNKTKLALTLISYFNNDMKMTRTAADLFIHLETLRYRLGRIEELTGQSLKTSEGQLILQLTARCYGNY